MHNHVAPFASQTVGVAATGNVADGAVARSVSAPDAGDLNWVWREVRKRVFIKLPFSRLVAEAMEAIVPISLDTETFICGLPSAKFTLSGALNSAPVRNTIETILQSASGHRIHFELIEGTSLADWSEIKERRAKAHEAMLAMAEKDVALHNYEAILNQVVSEIRARITATPDRIYPQVRMKLVFDIVPLLCDTADMLFSDREEHNANRAMARAIDRIANFLDMPPLMLALEVERYMRENAHQK